MGLVETQYPVIQKLLIELVAQLIGKEGVFLEAFDQRALWRTE